MRMRDNITLHEFDDFRLGDVRLGCLDDARARQLARRVVGDSDDTHVGDARMFEDHFLQIRWRHLSIRAVNRLRVTVPVSFIFLRLFFTENWKIAGHTESVFYLEAFVLNQLFDSVDDVHEAIFVVPS